MILHCPCCHAQFSIETVIQDESARELIAMKAEFPRSLFAYLSLFRPEKRALAWDRMSRLTREVLDLGQTWGAVELETALAETVTALRGRGKGPLKNHNYLKRVLESHGPGTMDQVPGTGMADRYAVTTDAGAAPRGTASKTSTAIGKLEQWKRG